MSNDSWCTPKKLYDIIMNLEEEVVDVCLPDLNALTDKNWVYIKNNLIFPKSQPCLFYLNPPYSRGSIEKFIDAAIYQARCYNNKSLMLLPADLSTNWSKKFWNHLEVGSSFAFHPVGFEVYFCPKRIKFEGAKAGAFFPNIFVWVLPNKYKDGFHYGQEVLKQLRKIDEYFK